MAVAIRAGGLSYKKSAGYNTGFTVPMPGCSAIGVAGAAASNNAGGGTSITVTMASGRAVGCVLVMAITTRLGTGMTITLPKNSNNENWTLLDRTNSTTNLAQATYWKLATSYDVSDASVVVTITSAKASAVMVAITGADTTAPAAAQYGGQANASSLTVSYAALSTWTSTNGISLLFGGMAYGGNTVGLASGYDERGQSSSTGSSAASRTQTHGSSDELSAVTTVGTKSETWTGSAAVNIGSQVFIKEVASTPVTENDDVLLMFIHANAVSVGPPTITGPSGWTQLVQSTGTGWNTSGVWWKKAASEPTSYAVSWPESYGCFAFVVCLSGADNTAAPVAAQYDFSSATSSTTVTWDALGTWASTNGMDFAFTGRQNTPGITTPTDYTLPTDGYQKGSSDEAAIYHRSLTAVTTVGGFTTSAAGAATHASIHTFIKEAAGGAATEDVFPYVGGGYYG